MSGPIEDGHKGMATIDTDVLVTVVAVGFLLSVWLCIWTG